MSLLLTWNDLLMFGNVFYKKMETGKYFTLEDIWWIYVPLQFLLGYLIDVETCLEWDGKIVFSRYKWQIYVQHWAPTEYILFIEQCLCLTKGKLDDRMCMHKFLVSIKVFGALRHLFDIRRSLLHIAKTHMSICNNFASKSIIWSFNLNIIGHPSY